MLSHIDAYNNLQHTIRILEIYGTDLQHVILMHSNSLILQHIQYIIISLKNTGNLPWPWLHVISVRLGYLILMHYIYNNLQHSASRQEALPGSFCAILGHRTQDEHVNP